MSLILSLLNIHVTDLSLTKHMLLVNAMLRRYVTDLLLPEKVMLLMNSLLQSYPSAITLRLHHFLHPRVCFRAHCFFQYERIADWLSVLFPEHPHNGLLGSAVILSFQIRIREK